MLKDCLVLTSKSKTYADVTPVTIIPEDNP